MKQEKSTTLTRKLTTKAALENEYLTLAEALGCGIELNADFISRFIEGERPRELLLSIPESERADAIKHAEISHTFPGFVVGTQEGDIVLPCNEIEVQFEGKPEDYFEEPGEWAISNGHAYLYTGYGLLIRMSLAKLTKYCKELASDVF